MSETLTLLKRADGVLSMWEKEHPLTKLGCALRAALAAESARADHERHEKETVADAFAAFKRYHNKQKAELTARADRIEAECRALSGTLEAAVDDYNRMKQSYEQKVEQFAAETLARSREATARQEAGQLLAEARRERDGEAKRGDEAYGLLAGMTAERDRLRAELAEAKDSAHYANGVAELAMKHRDAAEAELARLRDQLDMVWEQLAGEDI